MKILFKVLLFLLFAFSIFSAENTKEKHTELRFRVGFITKGFLNIEKTLNQEGYYYVSLDDYDAVLIHNGQLVPSKKSFNIKKYDTVGKRLFTGIEYLKVSKKYKFGLGFSCETTPLYFDDFYHNNGLVNIEGVLIPAYLAYFYNFNKKFYSVTRVGVTIPIFKRDQLKDFYFSYPNNDVKREVKQKIGSYLSFGLGFNFSESVSMELNYNEMDFRVENDIKIYSDGLSSEKCKDNFSYSKFNLSLVYKIF